MVQKGSFTVSIPGKSYVPTATLVTMLIAILKVNLRTKEGIEKGVPPEVINIEMYISSRDGTVTLD